MHYPILHVLFILCGPARCLTLQCCCQSVQQQTGLFNRLQTVPVQTQETTRMGTASKKQDTKMPQIGGTKVPTVMSHDDQPLD